MKNFLGLACLLLAIFTISCSQHFDPDSKSNNISPFISIPDTFEEYEKTVYKEPFENGIYIVNGDTPIENIKELRKFYDKLIKIKKSLSNTNEDEFLPRKLIIEKSEDDSTHKWSDAQKLQLTYCISKSTAGYSYNRIIGIIEDAMASWEEAANINFIHLIEYDDNCNAQTEEVLFDVRLQYGIPYEARSFSPGQSRETRNIIINSGYIYKSTYLRGLLKHELGHVLGFRHEHIRPEANSPEDHCMDYGYGYWEALTDYDSDSVMHYPECGGTAESFELTNLDIEGAQRIYGAPGEEPIDEPIVGPIDGPVIVPEITSKTIEYKALTVTKNEQIYYGPISVTPGTQVKINMTGTGDVDIYLKFDSAPELYSYDSRAYAAHSNESIVMNVPDQAREIYIMVHGYSNSLIDLEITYALK